MMSRSIGTGSGDFAALGVPGEGALELVLVHVHVGRRVGRELEGLPHVDEGLRLVGDLDRLTGPDLGARHVDAAAVDLHVAVADQLARLALGEREAHPQHDGVQAGLELAHQLLAGDAGLPAGTVVVGAHLALAHRGIARASASRAADLVLREALAAATVLPGRIGALHRRAVGPSADGLTDAAAHAVARSDLVHAGD